MSDSAAGGNNGFGVCENVEQACAELYHYFAELFRDERESLLLWVKAAMEEENHARLFALLAKLEGKGPDPADAEALLRYVRSHVDAVKKAPPTMQGALRLAIELETKLGGFLREQMVKMADHSVEKSLLNITAAGSRQLDSFHEAYCTYAAR